MTDQMLEFLAEFERIDAMISPSETDLDRWRGLCTQVGLVAWLAAEYRRLDGVLRETTTTACMAAHELTLARATIAELERHLSNLLAVIHQDGGHYQAEHGNEAATTDAILKWRGLKLHIDKLEEAALSVVSVYKITCYNWKKQMDTRIEKLSKLLPEPPQ